MKIRLHGTQKENEDFVEELEKIETIKILSVSKPYLDRGRSVFERVYIDCELKDKVQMLKNAIAGETVFYCGKQAIRDFIETFELGAQLKANGNKFYYEWADVQGLIKGIKLLLEGK